MRIKRALDRTHHAHRPLADLIEQDAHFVQTHAVLAGSGAAQALGARHQLWVEPLRGGKLGGVLRDRSKLGGQGCGGLCDWLVFWSQVILVHD